MPVIIKEKITLAINATSQTPPSNKEEQTKIDISKICYLPYNDIHKYKNNIIICRPAIDWLEVGCAVPEEDRVEIVDGLNAFINNNSDFKLFPPKQDKRAFGYTRSFYWLNEGKLTTQVLIAFIPYGHTKENKYKKPSGKTKEIDGKEKEVESGERDFIKIILQPSGLTTNDMAAFEGFWGVITQNYPHLSLHSIYARPDAIKRLDICVDMLNVHVSSLVVKIDPKILEKYPKKKKQLAYLNKTGRLETKYLPHNPKDIAREYVYDKRKELLDNGHDFPYGALPLTRFEKRVATEKSVHGLVDLKNHMEAFEIKAFNFRALKGKNHSYALFVNYALLRTVEKAADLIPEKHRKKYMDFFNNNLIELWDTQKLWDKWPDELKRLRLLDKK